MVRRDEVKFVRGIVGTSLLAFQGSVEDYQGLDSRKNDGELIRL